MAASLLDDGRAIKQILLQLEQCRDCLASLPEDNSLSYPSRSDIQEEGNPFGRINQADVSQQEGLYYGMPTAALIRLQLRVAGEAAETATPPTDGPLTVTNWKRLVTKAETAVKVLALAVAALQAEGSPRGGNEAVTAGAILSGLTKIMSKSHQQQVFWAADASARALAEGDCAAAASAALVAEAASASAMWAACLGGLQLVREARAAQLAAARAADAVLQRAQVDPLTPLDSIRLHPPGTCNAADVEPVGATCSSPPLQQPQEPQQPQAEEERQPRSRQAPDEQPQPPQDQEELPNRHHGYGLKQPQGLQELNGASAAGMDASLASHDALREQSGAAAPAPSEPGQDPTASSPSASSPTTTSTAQAQAVIVVSGTAPDAGHAEEADGSGGGGHHALPDVGIAVPAAVPARASTESFSAALAAASAPALATEAAAPERPQVPTVAAVKVASLPDAAVAAPETAGEAAAAPSAGLPFQAAASLEHGRLGPGAAPPSVPSPEPQALSQSAAPAADDMMPPEGVDPSASQLVHVLEKLESMTGFDIRDYAAIHPSYESWLAAIHLLVAASCERDCAGDTLAPTTRRRLLGVARVEISNCGGRSADIFVSMIADDWARGHLIKLVAYAVRQLRDGLVYGISSEDDPEVWLAVLQVVGNGIKSLRSGIRGDGDYLPAAAAAEMLRLLVLTELPQALRALLAAITEVAAAQSSATYPSTATLFGAGTATATVPVPPGSRVSNGDGASGSAGAVAAVVDANGSVDAPVVGAGASGASRDLGRLLFSVCTFLAHLVRLVCLSSLDVYDTQVQEALWELHVALFKSRVLDHASRAVALAPSNRMLTVNGSNASGGSTAAAAVASGLEAPDTPAPAFRSDATPSSVPVLAGLLECLMRVSDAAQHDGSHVDLADALLSGPCVHRFLLLHAVSQLCAADGGTDYGLPAGASLRPLWEEEEWKRHEDEMPEAPFCHSDFDSSDGDGSGKRHWVMEEDSGGGPSGRSPHLGASVLIQAFTWWSGNPVRRPCSDRALRLVCERAAAVALASVPVNGCSARFGPRDFAMCLAMMAHRCAVELVDDGSAGDCVGLWSTAVLCTDVAVQAQSPSGNRGFPSPLGSLLWMPLPPLWRLLTEGSGSLPAQPDPELAAALAAGFVPCLERAMRNEVRSALGKDDRMPQVVSDVNSVLGDLGGLPGLLAYGELRAVASLLATAVKTVVVIAGTAAKDSDLVSPIVFGSAALWNCCKVEPGPPDQRWWLRHSGCGTRQAGRALAGTAGAALGPRGIDSCTGGAGGSGFVAAAGGALSPLHKAMVLGSFTAVRWLLLFKSFFGSWSSVKQPIGYMEDAVVAALHILSPLLHACADCRLAANGSSGSGGCTSTTLHARGAGADGCGGGSDNAGGQGGGDDERLSREAAEAARRAACNWEWLLLEELDLPGMLRAAITWYHAGFCRRYTLFVPRLMTALLHFMVAFPQQAVELLRLRLPNGGTTHTWLKGSLERHWGNGPAVQHFLALAQQIAACKAPGREDILQLRSDPDRGWLARLGPLLPPPCFVAEALQLPLCANPSCDNLEGGSEAALRLATACKDCGDRLSYCCRACKQAHWKGGHKAVCSRGPARGRGRCRG